MHGLLDQIGAFIQAHQAWAGPIVGLFAFFECLAIVGILLPAPPVMVAIGGMIGAGLIDPATTLLGAMIGAVAGFFVSYMIGRWLGPGIVHRWPLKNYRSAVAQARLLFRRYASLSVFIGRFLGPLRVTVPLIAGMTGMSHHRFQIANVASALIWAPLFMAPGWLAARGLENFAELTEAHWIAIGAAGLALAGLALAAGFRLQRARLLRRRRLAERAQRRLEAQAAPAR